MPQLKYQYHPEPGLQTVVSPQNSMLEYISLRVLRLLPPAGPHHGHSGGEELALVVMTGLCTVRVGDHCWEQVGGRKSVFQQSAHVVYVPPGSDFEVSALGGPVEIAIGGALADRPGTPALITPAGARYERRGIWNWERHIYDAITHVNPVSQRLYIIEVITPPGNWSSVPPHKHDTDNPPLESKAEEIYFFKFEPEQGFGFQRVYTDDGSLDEVCLAEHNSAIIQPRGYHPVANHPGYQMYYLNIIAGEKRALIPFDDPAHAWVKHLEAVIRTRYP